MTTQAEAYALYKDDYLYHDRVEDVTILLDSGGSKTNVKAKMELPRESLVSMGEGVNGVVTTCRWTVWDSTLDGAVLHENDVIQRSNGDKWRIKDTSLELFDTQWHCNTQKDL